MEIPLKADPTDSIIIDDDITIDGLVLLRLQEYRHGIEHTAHAWLGHDEAVKMVNHLCHLFDI